MPRILLIGLAPDAVDYSDPALPPGMTAATIAAGIALGLELMADRGWQADFCALRPDASAGPEVERQFAAARYDCVVIGGGIRLPAGNLLLFESIVNAIVKAAPGTPIAFNTSPQDSADAAARWVASA